MRSQFEPLLGGLYKVGHCLVLLLNKQGQVLYKSLPRGYADLYSSEPELFASYLQQIRSVAFPVLLSATQQVGGMVLADGTTLVVGPLSKRLPLKHEHNHGSCAGAGSKDKHASSSSSFSAAASPVATADATGAPSAKEIAIAEQVESTEGESELLQLRRQAVNVQLESIAWLSHRWLGLKEPRENDELDRQELKVGGSLENEVLQSLTQVRSILPDWREVVPEERPHSSYTYEYGALDAIRRGEPHQFLLAQTLRADGQNGVLGYTPLRAEQNLSICGVVLNSRAAVSGGLPVEQAYTVADFLILTIERCKSVQQARYVGLQSGKIFALLVRRIKKQYPKKVMHTLSVQALEMVQRFLYTKVTREQLAAELNVNPDYLDRVLKADCDRTALGCLRAARVEEAKRLLLQTSTPIYEIASLLNFSNSSHFSRVFKEHTGSTPLDYRQLQQNTSAMFFL